MELLNYDVPRGFDAFVCGLNLDEGFSLFWGKAETVRNGLFAAAIEGGSKKAARGTCIATDIFQSSHGVRGQPSTHPTLYPLQKLMTNIFTDWIISRAKVCAAFGEFAVDFECRASG